MHATKPKFGYVTIIGATNVGKSTLVNALVGNKVSIVTRKQQTTRSKILGIFCFNSSQVVLVDTPGIFKPKRRLDRAMLHNAWDSIKDSDLIMLMIDANKDNEGNVSLIDHLKQISAIKDKKVICIINKIDLVKKTVILELTHDLQKLFTFQDFYFISALKGDGVKELKLYLSKNIPEGRWLFPEDQITNIPYRLLASELVREKLLNILHKELPYQIMVETEDWNDLEDRSVRIDILIYVNKTGQKKIVVGSGGENIKKVGILVRKELSRMLNKKVHIFIFVKVQKNWDSRPEYFEKLGLKYNV